MSVPHKGAFTMSLKVPASTAVWLLFDGHIRFHSYFTLNSRRELAITTKVAPVSAAIANHKLA